jgi:hypothetical protein
MRGILSFGLRVAMLFAHALHRLPCCNNPCKSQIISLTTHSGSFGATPVQMKWGAKKRLERGPVLCTVRHQSQVRTTRKLTCS